MATEGRTEAAPVSDQTAREALLGELKEHIHSFRFFQAVRLLQHASPERAPVGLFGHPADEVVRFGANPDLAFPAGEIQDLDRPRRIRRAGTCRSTSWGWSGTWACFRTTTPWR